MKMTYEKPLMEVQRFMANEFCSACGEGHTVYKFKCDAVSNSYISNGGLVYLETNGKEGLQTGWGGDELRSSYVPCGKTHEAEAIEGNFKRGYLTDYAGERPIDVIVWTGKNDDNTHCTTQLDMDKWETAKS